MSMMTQSNLTFSRYFISIMAKMAYNLMIQVTYTPIQNSLTKLICSMSEGGSGYKSKKIWKMDRTIYKYIGQ